MKLCTVCGVVTSHAGSRCTEHARQSNRSRHNVLYSTRAWQRLSARVLRAWRGEHGSWCPGYNRPAHPASDLTVDHVIPLAADGAPFDVANTSVLCRSCNSTKGASNGGGVAHTGTRSRPDRARRLRAHGRVLRIIPVADRGTEKPSDHDAFAVSPPFSPVGAHVGPGGALPAGVANHATGG